MYSSSEAANNYKEILLLTWQTEIGWSLEHFLAFLTGFTLKKLTGFLGITQVSEPWSIQLEWLLKLNGRHEQHLSCKGSATTIPMSSARMLLNSGHSLYSVYCQIFASPSKSVWAADDASEAHIDCMFPTPATHHTHCHHTWQKVSEWVGSTAHKQFRSLVPSLTRKAGTGTVPYSKGDPTLHKSGQCYINFT